MKTVPGCHSYLVARHPLHCQTHYSYIRVTVTDDVRSKLYEHIPRPSRGYLLYAFDSGKQRKRHTSPHCCCCSCCFRTTLTLRTARPLGRISKLFFFCRLGERENAKRCVNEIVPRPPFSLCMPPLMSRKSAPKCFAGWETSCVLSTYTVAHRHMLLIINSPSSPGL